MSLPISSVTEHWHKLSEVDWKQFFARKPKTQARLSFYEMLYSFLDAGISLDVMLNELIRTGEELAPRNPALKMYRSIYDRMAHEGVEFSRALEGWIPANEVVIIRAGESGDRDTLKNAVKALIDVVRKKYEINKIVMSKLSYPAVLVVANIALIHYLMTSFVPSIAEISSPDTMSATMKTAHALSMWYQDNLFYLMIGLAVVLFVFWYSITESSGFIRRRILDRIPPWSIHRRINGSTFLVAIGGMTSTGIDFNEALREIHHFSKNYLRYYIERMIDAIQAGASAGMALAQELFEPAERQAIAVFSVTNDLSDALRRIGEFSMRDLEQSVGGMAAIINVVAFGALGLVISQMIMLVLSIGNTSGM